MPYFCCSFSINSGTGGSPSPNQANRDPVDMNNDESGDKEKPEADDPQPPPPKVLEGDRGDNSSTEDANNNDDDEQKNPGAAETDNNCCPGSSSETSQDFRFGFQHDRSSLPTGNISSHNDGPPSPPTVPAATCIFPIPQNNAATLQASSLGSQELPGIGLNSNDPPSSLPPLPPLTYHPPRRETTIPLSTSFGYQARTANNTSNICGQPTHSTNIVDPLFGTSMGSPQNQTTRPMGYTFGASASGNNSSYGLSQPVQNQGFSSGTNGVAKPEPIPFFSFGYQTPFDNVSSNNCRFTTDNVRSFCSNQNNTIPLGTSGFGLFGAQAGNTSTANHASSCRPTGSGFTFGANSTPSETHDQGFRGDQAGNTSTTNHASSCRPTGSGFTFGANSTPSVTHDQGFIGATAGNTSTNTNSLNSFPISFGSSLNNSPTVMPQTETSSRNNRGQPSFPTGWPFTFWGPPQTESPVLLPHGPGLNQPERVQPSSENTRMPCLDPLATVRTGIYLPLHASNSDLVSPGTSSLNAVGSTTAESNVHVNPRTQDVVVVHILNPTTTGTKRAQPSDTTDDSGSDAKRSKPSNQERQESLQNSSAVGQEASLPGNSNAATASVNLVAEHDAIHLSDENMFTLPPLPLLNDALRNQGECRILNLKIGHSVHGEAVFFGYHRLPPGDICQLVKFEKGKCEITVREVLDCDLHVGANTVTLRGITRQDVMQLCGVARDRDISQEEFAILLDALHVQLDLIFSQYNEETETYIFIKNPKQT